MARAGGFGATRVIGAVVLAALSGAGLTCGGAPPARSPTGQAAKHVGTVVFIAAPAPRRPVPVHAPVTWDSLSREVGEQCERDKKVVAAKAAATANMTTQREKHILVLYTSCFRQLAAEAVAELPVAERVRLRQPLRVWDRLTEEASRLDEQLGTIDPFTGDGVPGRGWYYLRSRLDREAERAVVMRAIARGHSDIVMARMRERRTSAEADLELMHDSSTELEELPRRWAQWGRPKPEDALDAEFRIHRGEFLSFSRNLRTVPATADALGRLFCAAWRPRDSVDECNAVAGSYFLVATGDDGDDDDASSPP